jgi:hypothetical protein
VGWEPGASCIGFGHIVDSPSKGVEQRVSERQTVLAGDPSLTHLSERAQLRRKLANWHNMPRLLSRHRRRPGGLQDQVAAVLCVILVASLLCTMVWLGSSHGLHLTPQAASPPPVVLSNPAAPDAVREEQHETVTEPVEPHEHAETVDTTQPAEVSGPHPTHPPLGKGVWGGLPCTAVSRTLLCGSGPRSVAHTSRETQPLEPGRAGAFSRRQCGAPTERKRVFLYAGGRG